MIVVAGATGNIGRLVVDHLLRAGATDVRALTNNTAKATLPPHVQVVEGYLGRVETLPAAFEGVDRMYLGFEQAAQALGAKGSVPSTSETVPMPPKRLA